MATSARARGKLLVDTSVAVALTVGDHEHHADTSEALQDRRLGLAGHAAFETFSVLTRLPAPSRRTPVVVAQILEASFPHTRFLSPQAGASLLERLGSEGIAGGSVYDALVAGAASEHGLALATRDRRALDTYRKLGARIEFLG